MMEKSLKYYVFKDKNLVVEILKGKIEVIDYINFKKSQTEDVDYNPNMNFIFDFKDVDVQYNDELEKGFKEYIHIIKLIQIISKRRKAALITNTPNQVVSMEMYKLFDDRLIDYMIFTTYDKALEWLGILDFDYRLFEKLGYK